MENYALPCEIETKEDLKDGISLITNELVNKLRDKLVDFKYDKIHLMELTFENLKNSKFLIPFKACVDTTHFKEDKVYIHSGLNSIKDFNKGYIKYIKYKKSESYINNITSVDIVFSGPLFAQLSTQSNLFLLNYKNLLVEALRRQFYCYLKLISAEIHLQDIFTNTILPFIINEKYYFFQVQYIKENICKKQENDSLSGGFEKINLNFISRLLVIPNINELNSFPSIDISKTKNLEIESYLVKDIQNIKNILKYKSLDYKNKNNFTSTFYLDTTYMLNKYVMENNISIKILKNIKNNIIEKIRDILEEITKFNNLNSDKNIFIYLFLYNYITSFSKLSAQDFLITQLKECFSKFDCLKKLTFLEYKDSQNPISVSYLDRSNICTNTLLNTHYLKCLIMTRNNYNSFGGKILHENEKLVCYKQSGNEIKNEKKEGEISEDELIGRYLKLKKDLNVFVSILLLDKNLDAFLELMYYQSLNGNNLELLEEDSSENGSIPINIRMVNWIIRVCFGISDKQLVYKIVEILFENLVIGNILYNSYMENKEILLYNNKTVEISDGKVSILKNGDLSFKDESIKSIIQQVNDQLLIYKVFENEYSKINQIMNQQFTPRILIYNKGENTNKSKLSIVKQELINYIQKHYIDYKFVHKHILNLLSPYVGQSEENIRQLFNTNIPTILILEGIDVISSNFAISNKQTSNCPVKDNTNFRLKNDSDIDDTNCNYINYSPDLFNDISFRINLHKERIKDMFNPNWALNNLTQYNCHLKNDDDNQSPSENSNDSRTLLTTLLLCLDNIEKKNQNVILIAFSNKHILELDESITRAGRLDIHLSV
ncbi:uncharacterized protein cubi_01184 [Cryptosporidium ubiquitum]|uniref:Uncharacterized protein n=1 Tax=Cryptosporidium ubiquitum TaxID=857276 RepID=A0A1J4MMU5_9CRYT|nr:uncharacterized protein cubi_01184 [Cryptosporidium ubiquitum]OII74340.1 hypothetical protein cubi_01184 [Cryptosporidium ubiquitum]